MIGDSEIPLDDSPGGYLPASMLLQWHITDRCNLSCAHCYQGRSPGDDLPFKQLVEIFDQYLNFIASCRKRVKGRRFPAHITVTGGEPFLRGDFFDLLELFARHRRAFSFAVLTNGTMIDPMTARRLHTLHPGFVQVSIEGSPEAHDAIRGSGNHDLTVQAIQNLVKSGICTFISFTAHRGNFRDVADVIALGRRLGVARVWADRLIPAGRGEALKDQSLSPGETREFFDIMKGMKKGRFFHGRTEVAMHRALQFLAAGGKPYRCSAGDRLVTIMPNGDLLPCRRMAIRIGNVFEKPFAELYQGDPLLQKLRNPSHVPAGCRACFYARLCAGGLRCLGFATTGDPFVPDPGCWLSGAGIT